MTSLNPELLRKIKRIDELDTIEETLSFIRKIEHKAIGSAGTFYNNSFQNIYFYEVDKNAHQINVSNLEIYTTGQTSGTESSQEIKNHPKRYEWKICAFFTSDNIIEDTCTFLPEGTFTVGDYNDREKLGLDGPVALDVNQDFFEKNPEKKLYLAVSSVTDPLVTATKYLTEGQVYFVEEPVAEAIYNGDRLSESRILCGRVVCNGETIDDGVFLWSSPSKIVCSQSMDYQSYRVVFYKPKLKKRHEFPGSRFFEGPRNLRPSRKKLFLGKISQYKAVGVFDLCVPVYPKKDHRFDTYVWAKNILSNERALEKNINLEKDTYCYENLLKYKSHHEYKNIFDGFSLNELYPNIESIGSKSPKEVAREIVRNLLRKPKGRRCISIDPSDVLESLMLGPIHIADKLEYKGTSEDKKRIRLEQDYLYSMVYFGPSDSSSESLLSGEGYFYYDAPIHIDAPKLKLPNEYKDIKTKYDNLLKALYCNPNVQNGDSEKKDISGCEAMRNLLDKIFKEVSSYGVNIDYVFCDFEVMRNTANDMRIKHRLPSSDTEFINNPAYDFVISPDEDDMPLTKEVKSASNNEKEKKEPTDEEKKRWNVWNTLWASLKKRKDMEVPGSYRDIFNKLKQRGFVILNPKFRLDSVAISNVDQYGYFYAQTYEERRNINIWDQVALEYSAGLFDEYMMAPIRMYSKKVRCSLHAVEEHKGYIHNSDEFERYLGGSVKLPPTMCSAPRIYVSRSQDIYKRCMDNWIALPNDNSPFAALVGTVNNVRAARLSNLDKHNQPIFASVHYWIWTLCKTHELLSNDFTELQKLDEKNKEIEYQIKALENKEQTDEVKQQIDELKEQSKTLLKNFNSKKEKFIVLCNSENVSKLAKRCHEYYKELLIHSWLCDPEMMYAYLNYHDHSLRNTLFDHFVFRNKSNANTVFEKISEQEYCWETYQYIQDIADEMKTAIGDLVMRPITKTLASETDPFILSGVRIGKKNLFRLTIHDNFESVYRSIKRPIIHKPNPLEAIHFKPIPYIKPIYLRPNPLLFKPLHRISKGKRDNFEFVINGKHIIFLNAQIIPDIQPKPLKESIGFWIEMPAGQVPHIMTEADYYQKNPSIDIKIEKKLFEEAITKEIFAEKNTNGSVDITRLSKPYIVSVFGECARKQKISTEIQFNNVNKQATVLGVSIDPSKNGFTTNNKYTFENSLNLESFDADGKISTSLTCNGSVVPALNNQLNVRIRDSKAFNGRTIRHLIDRELEYLDIYYDKYDCVSWYKSIIQGMNFRVDVFRESDGVNISQVNKYWNPSYDNLPVETSSDDILRLRVSWLNATEHRQSYKVICVPRLERKLRFPLKLFRRSYDIPAGSEEYKLYKIGRAGSFGSFLDVYVEQNGKRELVYSIPINGR